MTALNFPTTTLTIRQLALLDYYVNENPSAYTDVPHTEALMAELPTQIVTELFPKKGDGTYSAPAANPAWSLLKALAASNEDLKTQLADIKVAWTKPTTPGTAAVAAAVGRAAVKAIAPHLVSGVAPVSPDRQQIHF
jgi:hypothetical protein